MIQRRPEGRAVADGLPIDAGSLMLHWRDPAAQWGVGVFETLRIAGGVPLHWREHLDRLEMSAARMNVPLPSALWLADAAREVAASTSDGLRWLKIVASRSSHWVVYAGTIEPSEFGRPISAVVLAARRHRLDPLVGIKTLAYAPAILGLEEAHRRGADEGIWLNERGHVIGACAANLFVVRGRAAVTPSLTDGARDGVTRAHAIEALREAGLSVRQAKVRVTTLRAADEVFLTSSLTGVRPVVRLDGRDVRAGEPGPVTKALRERLAGADVHSAVSGTGSEDRHA